MLCGCAGTLPNSHDTVQVFLIGTGRGVSLMRVRQAWLLYAVALLLSARSIICSKQLSWPVYTDLSLTSIKLPACMRCFVMRLESVLMRLESLKLAGQCVLCC